VRPWHDASLPVHVTLRVLPGLVSLRDFAVAAAIGASFKRLACKPERFRVVEFSLQDDHAHLVVEAQDRMALSAGVKGVSLRIAKAVNRVMGRKGQVIQERAHLQVLGTPTQARNAVAYVVGNWQKHGAPAGEIIDGLDSRSSARWSRAWRSRRPDSGPAPVSRARTWMLSGMKKLEPGSGPRSLAGSPERRRAQRRGSADRMRTAADELGPRSSEGTRSGARDAGGVAAGQHAPGHRGGDGDAGAGVAVAGHG
jgi:REP element-mobilizing transposase RayT